jgi:cardiolipin synthase A/B
LAQLNETPVDIAALARARAFERAARAGNPRVFGGGDIAFPEIVKRIGQARERIDVRAFLWRDDDTGNQLGQALLDAAERGVKVRIDKDRIAAVYEYTGGNKQSFFHKRIDPVRGFQAWFLGSVYRTPGSIKQKPNPLVDAILGHPNIEVRHKRKRFDHSKVFVFDDEIMVLGSMGIGDNHKSDWIDVMVEVSGKEHVDRLHRRFAGELEFDPARRIDFLVHNRAVQPPRTCPMVDERIGLIDRAERSIVIEMAYLGDKRFTAALLRAVKRGVTVVLITSRADVLGNLNLRTCNLLLRRTGAPQNLTICILPRVVHSKFVVVDGQWSDIGSANFTPLSHGVYDEINMHVNDVDFALRLEEVALAHCGEGQVVTDRVFYKRFASSVERAVVAYQSRKGG